MLIDEAQTLEPSEAERLLARVEAEGIHPPSQFQISTDSDEEKP